MILQFKRIKTDIYIASEKLYCVLSDDSMRLTALRLEQSCACIILYVNQQNDTACTKL